MGNLLEVKDLSYCYGSHKVIENLSFEANSGEILALAGPNGSGKTTTMRLISNILQVQEGQIYINGINHEKMNLDIMYLQSDQELPLFLTGEEYLQMMCSFYHVPFDHDKAMRYYDYFDLHVQNKLIETYSHGMIKKIQFIASLLVPIKILIVDETLNGMDIKSRDVSTLLMKQLAKNGVLIILCTHDLLFAQEVGERVLFIGHGHIFSQFNLKDHDYNLSEEFRKMVTFKEEDYVL
ncbi:ABC-2 type transport system ATP-binding protein [Kandleria vitulina]|uniref:ATP-binding cassette domain-containing protein n=1 Tax=Kandleria vitulina TaxID=1630 RepID=UPI000490D167|nr:ABC transporter ATP-binding protein [Kandleria vitulina]SDM18529.1 ABC-2 type transport system ATP-binding protein [Kandleria vitulina]SEJ33830.1 ABC-2 type transport system ATP-binding protein [Kandleria vitulina]